MFAGSQPECASRSPPSSPLASSKPTLTAEAGPPFGFRKYRIASPNFRNRWRVSSVEPSSTTRISRCEAGKSCASALEIASSMNSPSLYVSIRTVKNGAFILAFFGSSRRGLRQLRAFRRNDLFDDGVQPACNFPIRIVVPEFPKIRDITNVIAFARFFHVAPVQLAPGHLLDLFDRFQHGNTVRAAATQVVHLAGPRLCSKLLEGAHHVMAVNLVAHLFALVAKNGILSATERDFHQIRQEAVQLHAGC